MVTSGELWWAAGFIEGEGSFGKNHPLVNAIQVQQWPLIKLQRILGGRVRFSARASAKNPNWSDAYGWFITGPSAVGVMMTLYPLLSPKRQAQILRAINLWKTRGLHPSDRTTCKNGHPFDRTWRGLRMCRRCKTAAWRRWRDSKKLRIAMNGGQWDGHNSRAKVSGAT